MNLRPHLSPDCHCVACADYDTNALTAIEASLESLVMRITGAHFDELKQNLRWNIEVRPRPIPDILVECHFKSSET